MGIVILKDSFSKAAGTLYVILWKLECRYSSFCLQLLKVFDFFLGTEEILHCNLKISDVSLNFLYVVSL